jgi:hypothetical protein
MGPNTTGKPNTSDYSLGRGVIYFSLIDNAGKPLAWRDLGNAPEFNVSIEKETLEHQSSRSGLKVVDKEVVISQSVSCAFKLDELNHENLAAFFSGEKAAYTNAAIAGFAEWVMVPDGKLEAGRWYDIQSSAGARAYGIDFTKLTVKDNQGAPVTLVKDTDYEVDAKMGRIFTISTSTAIATAIAAGKGLKVTLTADGTAHAVNEVRALTQSAVKGALKFIGENPANNDEKSELVFHQISLKADGDFGLISDEFTQMGFTGKAEKNTSNTLVAASPTLTIRNVI